MKEQTRWYSSRLQQETQLVRWGDAGVPVLLFPTAGGDAEECERFHLIGAVGDLLSAGRARVYCCDSIAGRTWLMQKHSPEHCTLIQNQFDAYLYKEVVPAIRADCDDPEIEILTAGSSIGAFNALATLCRHPDVFRAAICMSGTYDLTKYTQGRVSPAFAETSPLHFVPDLGEGAYLDRLRERFVLLTHGEGKWEEPEQSWRVARVLGSKRIPNRVDPWGSEYDHDWPTWRAMFPQYLDEFVD